VGKTKRIAMLMALSVGATACGSSGPAGDDIPIIEDDGSVDAGGDTARPVADSASRDVSGSDGAGTDVVVGDARDAAETADGATTGDVMTDVPVVDRCTGVSTAPFQPPTTCSGPSGYTTTEIPPNRVYASSWFGCYRKADGTIYKDPTDNCLFACGNKGLCSSTATGPECEATLQWFAADADRYGCGARIRVTNCVNRRSVILVTLDRGPNCRTVEQAYAAPTLDMSHQAMVHLFEGATYGVSDKKRVLVEAVADTTPLGPE
jgi:hypothetical protein